MPQEALLKPARRAGARSAACTMIMLAIAESTAYCHPNSTWVESRNTNASETVRPPFSSSGTGLYSAAVARQEEQDHADHRAGTGGVCGDL